MLDCLLLLLERPELFECSELGKKEKRLFGEIEEVVITILERRPRDPGDYGVFSVREKIKGMKSQEELEKYLPAIVADSDELHLLWQRLKRGQFEAEDNG